MDPSYYAGGNIFLFPIDIVVIIVYKIYGFLGNQIYTNPYYGKL